ncbi:MAG: prefoldin subunit alpha [Candidatus Bathyarchaeia archaeon]
MSSEDEVLRQKIIELRILEGSVNLLQSRLEIINAALNEVILASSTLEGAKGSQKGSQALIPIGAGSFLRAELVDVEKVIIGVGSNVCIEKSIDESIDELKNRRAELEKAKISIQKQLEQTIIKLEEERKNLEELIKKKGGESIKIV